MNWIDILLGASLIVGLIVGFREGIMVQLGGIGGILVGVFLASKFGERVGSMAIDDENVATVVGFVVIIIATLIVIALLSHALRGLFKFAGLGTIDKLGGAVLSMIKVGLVISLLIAGFDTLNNQFKWTEQATIERSKMYEPLKNTASYIFPFFNSVKNKLN